MSNFFRNAMNRFSRAAVTKDISRSLLPQPHKNTTTMNSGYLYPIDWMECLPGTTYDMKSLKALVRMNTPKVPVMDSAYIDTFVFFTPYRLLWDHWREFQGENKLKAWNYQMPEYRVPGLVIPSNGFKEKGVADYLGLPTKTNRVGFVSAFLHRDYRLIWNEWFRPEAVVDPILVNTGDTDPEYAVGPKNDDLLKVARFPDYFSTALPAPQYGEAVSIGLVGDTIPVTTMITPHTEPGDNTNPLRFASVYGADGDMSDAYGYSLLAYPESGAQHFLGANKDAIVEMAENYSPLVPSNLYANLGDIGAVTINDLRLAFQIQRYKEALARGGNRYVEILNSIWNVQCPDSRLQRPEYVGGYRQLLNMSQVLQTSADTEASPLGFAGGFSKTSMASGRALYSCPEHGVIMVLACIRPVHSYQQGVDPFFKRRDLFDFYVPELANIGEQPIYKSALYAYAVGADEQVFGYAEAWADYRWKRSIVTGEMRSNSSNKLDQYHYADDYDAQVSLSEDWIMESPDLIDRTIAVTSELSDQFRVDFYFDVNMVHPMPTHSIPGLIDHH